MAEHREKLILRQVRARFFLQLKIRLLQFFLPFLQFARERLRLFEQVFRARIRLDSIENDADALGQLIKKCLMGSIEPFERRKFDHRFRLSFKQDWQNHKMARTGFAQR